MTVEIDHQGKKAIPMWETGDEKSSASHILNASIIHINGLKNLQNFRETCRYQWIWDLREHYRGKVGFDPQIAWGFQRTDPSKQRRAGLVHWVGSSDNLQYGFLPWNMDVACSCSLHPIQASIKGCWRKHDFISKEELLICGFCWGPTWKHLDSLGTKCRCLTHIFPQVEIQRDYS